MYGLIEYLRETRRELTKVNWPTRSQTIKSTILVVVFSIVVALYLGALDSFFRLIWERIIAI
ncbi:MAG: preprotein translocase subunit SecE [Patescibacteria group bacterium]